MKINKIARLASLISRHIEKSTTNKKHVAACISNGKITFIRNNSAGIHAEYLCAYDYAKFYSKSCSIILVIRFENGIYKNSKPCKDCILKLKKNVKKIIYSTGNSNNPFTEEKINNISNTWRSSFNKNLKDRVYLR